MWVIFMPGGGEEAQAKRLACFRETDLAWLVNVDRMKVTS